MNKFLLVILFLLPFTGISQDDEMPATVDEVIKWSLSVTYEGDIATVSITAKQLDHWHVYSRVQPAGSVAFGTEVTLIESDNYQLKGSMKEYGAE